MEEKRPHILLITADELAKEVLGCYGTKVIATPNLDTLAQESIVFDRAYTSSPWCLPARCSMLTGLYPHNNRAYSNKRERLAEDIPNLYTELKQAGYTVGHIGKCHYAPVPYSQTNPDQTQPYDEFRNYYLRLGIDHLDLQDDKQVSVWFYDDYAAELDQEGLLKPYRDAVWNKEYRKVFDFPGPEMWHPDSWVGRKAQEYIGACSGDEPVFCWVSFSGPHFPFDPPAQYHSRVDLEALHQEQMRVSETDFTDRSRIHYSSYHGPGGIDGSGSAPGGACGHYSDEYWFELRRNYYANVAQIDDYIGRIVEQAYRSFGENLLIIFTADHGEMLGHHGLWGKNNCAYEEVWAIPMLVKYPQLRQGLRTDAMVMSTDVMATCLKAAGVQGVKTDGRDMKAWMDDGGRSYVYSEGEGFIAISDGRYKYVQVQQGKKQHYELFDRETDPCEFENVIDQDAYALVASRLRQELLSLLLQSILP